MSIVNAHKAIVNAAKEIEQEWRLVDNEITLFAAIAEEKFVGLNLEPLGDLSNIPKLLEDGFIGALQEPSTFSDVYIKLFDNGRFYIELLNWWGSDINIHDHDFSAVQFQLTGQALNVVYGFKEDKWSPLSVGNICVDKAEIWNKGDHSIVEPGTSGAHTVNHMSFPTVSLLVRTHGAAAYGPQRNYFPPFVAGNYGVADIIFRKRVRLLRTLASGPKVAFQRAFKEVVAAQSATENLFLFIKMFDIIFREQHSSLLENFIQSGGEIAEAIVSASAYHCATDFIINHVKRTEGLTDEHILVCSILGSCYDLDSFNKINRDIEAQGYQPDIERAVAEIHEKLLPYDQSQFSNILKLFNLDLLDCDISQRKLYSPAETVFANSQSAF